MASDALARITAHFDALSTRKIHVPEWQLDVYVSPVTLAERSRIYRGSKGDNDHEVLFNILLVKARDAEGKPLFTVEDKISLLQHAESSVLIRLCADIMSGGPMAPPTDELKN